MANCFAHNWNNGILELWNDGFKEKTKAHIFAVIQKGLMEYI